MCWGLVDRKGKCTKCVTRVPHIFHDNGDWNEDASPYCDKCMTGEKHHLCNKAAYQGRK